MSRIADIILEAGRARAEALREGGQIVGNTIAGIGAIPAQAQVAAQQRQMNVLKAQDMKGQIDERTAQAAQTQRALAGAQAGVAAIHAATDPDTGAIDHEKVGQLWEAAGFPTQAQAYLDAHQKTQQTQLQITEAQQKIAEGQQQQQVGMANHLGELAADGLDKLKTGTPMESRDYAMGLLANAVTNKTIPIEQAQPLMMHIASATPDQLAGLYQQTLDAAPAVKTRLTEEALKKSTTAKNIADAAEALAKANGANKPDTAEADKQRYRNIQSALQLKQPVSAADAAWAASYEKEKTIGPEATAAAAADRQASTQAQQNTIQQNAQDFAKQQAGRKELTEKVEAPLQTAQASAQELRDTVAAAKAGNKIAANFQALQATMSTIRSNGLNRLNQAEMNLPAGAGSLWDTIQGKFGKLTTGDPIDASLQSDLLKYADLIEQGAKNKYLSGFDSVTKRYGLTDEQSKVSAVKAGGDTAGPKDGETKPIPGHPGTEQTFKGGKWVRTK